MSLIYITDIYRANSEAVTCCDSVNEICRHLACEEEREEEVRLLVSAGADASLLNEVTTSVFNLLTSVSSKMCGKRKI